MTVVYEPSQTTHWRKLFADKSQLLGAHNLKPGEELVAIIKGTEQGKIKNKSGGEEAVPMIHFENAPSMVLNVTNTKTIASLYGEYMDQWAGKTIQIYAQEVTAFGNTGLALRIRPTIPQQSVDPTEWLDALEAADSLEALTRAYMSAPAHVQPLIREKATELKGKFENANT